MFLNEKYVLANEAADKHNIRIGNFSQLVKNLVNDNNFKDFEKRGNCTFINKDSNNLGPMMKFVNSGGYTDFSNKLPITYLTKELEINKKELLSSLKDYIIGEVTVAKKKFIVFKDSFVKKLTNKTVYILNKEELDESLKEKYIDGFFELEEDKFLVYY